MKSILFPKWKLVFVSPFSKSCSTKVDHYSVLGINSRASKSDIRAAFLEKSKQFHPDVNKSDSMNHDKFVQINDAYSVLSKYATRQQYDMSRNMQNSNSTTKRHSSYYYQKGNEHQNNKPNRSYGNHQKFNYSGNSYKNIKRIEAGVLGFVALFSCGLMYLKYMMIQMRYQVLKRQHSDKEKDSE